MADREQADLAALLKADQEARQGMPARPVLPRPVAADYPGLAAGPAQPADLEEEQLAADLAAARRPSARLAADQQAGQLAASQWYQAAAQLSRLLADPVALESLHQAVAAAGRVLQAAADQWAAALDQAAADLAAGLLADLLGHPDQMRWYPPEADQEPEPRAHP